MRRKVQFRSLRIAIPFLLVLLVRTVPFGGNEKGSGHEWRHYGGDSGGSKYSPLAQINRENVSQLKVAWVFHTGDVPPDSMAATFECTPLVIDGVMYLTTAFSRVIALEAESGKELWNFDPKIDRRRSYNLFVNRGVAFWRRGSEQRIFLGTLDGRLFALQAADGKPVA